MRLFKNSIKHSLQASGPTWMHLQKLNNYLVFCGILIFTRKLTLELRNIPLTLNDYEERYLANETDACRSARRCNDLSCNYTSRFTECLCFPGFSGLPVNDGVNCSFINPEQTLTVEIAMEISPLHIPNSIPWTKILFWVQRKVLRDIYGGPKSWQNYVISSIRIYNYWYWFFACLFLGILCIIKKNKEKIMPTWSGAWQ